MHSLQNDFCFCLQPVSVAPTVELLREEQRIITNLPFLSEISLP